MNANEMQKRFDEMGLSNLQVKAPLANYVPALIAGDFIYVSGQLPLDATGKLLFPGHVGSDVTPEDAKKAARTAAINAVTALFATLPSTEQFVRLAKITGFVACAQGFTEIPGVVDGASDLMIELFGKDLGKHARAAVGVLELPKNACIEIELIAQIKS